MNRRNQVLLLGVGSIGSLGCFLWAANPRIVAWNQTANAALIAQQRAATCVIVSHTISPGMIVFNGKSETGKDGIWMTPGTLICDRRGNTAQVTSRGRVHYIRSAPPELLEPILDKRGMPTGKPIPTASPLPPPVSQPIK
jgi:hypothetical protein